MSISVCMATYNGQKYIYEQLTSILGQLSQNDEVIISDDSSTDDTVAIIESFKDHRIQLYKNQTFQSHVYNFENTLVKAKGEYIFLCDQDDIWLPHKIRTMLIELKKVDLVLSDAIVVDEGNKTILFESFFAFHHSRPGILKNLIKNSYLGCCMAFNRKILNLALPFPKDLNMHDWWIGLIAETSGTVAFSPEKIIYYRRHTNTLTSIGNKSPNSFLTKVRFRIVMIKNLMFRVLYKGKQL